MVGERDWNWEVYVSHGKTSVNAHQPEGFPFLPRVQNLFDANQYGENFDVSSLPGFVPIAVTGHCTSGLPLFNANGSVDDTPTVSQDCADWMVLRMNSVTTLTQEVVEGTVTGPIAELWAGELQFAFGANSRQEDFAFDPDSGFNANQRFPDVIQNIILPVTVDGSTDVTEVFAGACDSARERPEARPVVRDQSGRALVGLQHGRLGRHLQADRRLGGERSRARAGRPSVREPRTERDRAVHAARRQPALTPATTPAPTIPSKRPRGATDRRTPTGSICRRFASSSWSETGHPRTSTCRASRSPRRLALMRTATTYSAPRPSFRSRSASRRATPKLDTESANTTTVGVVMRPFERRHALHRLVRDQAQERDRNPDSQHRLSAVLRRQVQPVLGAAPGSLTGAALAAGNPFCALDPARVRRRCTADARATTARLAATTRSYINQGGSIRRASIYRWTGESATSTVNIVASYLDDILGGAVPRRGFHHSPARGDGAGNSSFDYRLFSTVNYSEQAVLGRPSLAAPPELDVAPGSAANTFGIDAHDQLDVFGSWRFTDRIVMRGGIDNLTNEDPEVNGRTTVNNNLGSTNSNYDQFGRRVFLGLSITL